MNCQKYLSVDFRDLMSIDNNIFECEGILDDKREDGHEGQRQHLQQLNPSASLEVWVGAEAASFALGSTLAGADRAQRKGTRLVLVHLRIHSMQKGNKSLSVCSLVCVFRIHYAARRTCRDKQKILP
jgi:hypothetical protein